LAIFLTPFASLTDAPPNLNIRIDANVLN